MISLRKSDIILEYIKGKVTIDFIMNNVKTCTQIGIDASEVEEKFNIVRNNASTLLNELVKSGDLVKINSRPVTFIPKSVAIKFTNNDSIKNTYSLEEIKSFIKFDKAISSDTDPFGCLIGKDSSLLNQILQAKAAVMYPPNGLHSLIFGDSGVGKTTFASAMYEYDKLQRGLNDKEFPFVSFNCSDYFNNPQLLLSQLFGYAKGAFTGADSDKIGLVEKANGGILFLDEVHRLPADGQEMLFYLMDKGEYHRLGETDKKRESNILIIAATTENPNGALLSTFLRRIPVIIKLPSYREKNVSEKIKIIQNLFYYESIKLNMGINVCPEVLKALVIYDFKVGNIGELSSEIKLLCAKAYLQYLQNSNKLAVEFKMLNKQITDFFFNHDSIDSTVKTFLDTFTEYIEVSPTNNSNSPNEILSEDTIYDLMDKNLDEFKSKRLSKEEIDQKLNTVIESYFNDVMNKFYSNNLSINQLYKILPKDLIDISAEFIKIAQTDLAVKLNNKLVLSLALHLDALLKRIHNKKKVVNPNINKIRIQYPDEYSVAGKIIKTFSDKFGIIVPEDEKGYIAILLANSKLNKASNEKIGIIVVCHGDSTATSMAAVSNRLLNVDLVKAIDMPLDVSISETYNKIKAAAIELNKNKGLFLLADMGSLVNLGDKLMSETGITVKTIANVSTLDVLEVSRNVLYKNDTIEDIYKTLINKDTDEIAKKNVLKNKAILSVCVTGQGASMIAQKLLLQILSVDYKNKFEIITLSAIDYEQNIAELSEKYDIVAYLSTYKLPISIPYFPISKLLDADFQRDFLKYLDVNINEKKVVLPSKSPYEIAKDMLEQYVKYINPKMAVVSIRKFIDSLNLTYEDDQGDLTNLIVHMGCMLDRCIHGDKVQFSDMIQYKEKNLEKFTEIRQSVKGLEEEYDIQINDDEVCYITKVLNKQ